MRGAWPRFAAMIAMLAALATCSSPNPVLYTVAPVHGLVRSGAPKVVVVQRVGLARYLERSQIVRSSEGYRLDVMSNDWWGEPPATMLTRVLVENLGQRLPGSVVLGENNALQPSPGGTVEVTIQRLDQDASSSLILQGQAGVRFGARGVPVLQDFRFVEPPSAPGTLAEVRAISAALGQLADRLAVVLSAGASPRTSPKASHR